MEKDRDFSLIFDLVIDNEKYSYKLSVVDDIDKLNDVRKKINTKLKKVKRDINNIQYRLRYCVDDVREKILKELKDVKEIKNDILKSLSEEIKEKNRLSETKRVIEFSGYLDKIKNNCVECKACLNNETITDKVLHKIKYGNYCKDCY